jgi:type 1 glutamine amidotransferase
MPGRWLHAKDELYHGQRGPALNMTILNSAFDDPAMGGTGVHEPMTWVIPFGQGKVVTTVMGHHMGNAPQVPSLQCIGFQAIVARASEWVATGEVTVPIPPNFPTAEKDSLGPALTQP